MNPTKRRFFPLVNPSHQYRFLAIILIYNVIVILVLMGILFLPDFIKLQDDQLSLETKSALAVNILQLHSRIWPAVIALICLIGLHSFRIFLRFIGPVNRFQWAFKQIRDGNLDFHLRIRKKDYLLEEERVLNEMILSLSQKLATIQDSLNESVRSLDRFEQDFGRDREWSETQKGLLSTHRSCLDRALETIQYFHFKK